MVPHQQFAGQGPSSPGTPRVPQAPAGNISVNRPTSPSSTPDGQIPDAPGRHPISLPKKPFQPAAEPCRTDVAGIEHLPPLPDISYGKFDANAESDDSSDSGGEEGKAQISVKQTEFSLKQFAKRMGQPNFSTFNKWRKVWAAGFLEKKPRSIIPGQNCLNQMQVGHLYWETTVAEFWRLSTPGRLGKISIMPNGFGDSVWRWF